MMTNDTIAAIATASGKGGIGIVRLSGPKAHNIAEQLIDQPLTPRYATYTAFTDQSKINIDSGIALYFPAPNSFTGQDVVELQGHGGAIILDLLLNEVLRLGARIARPGEFSERAFINNKIDLVQAEAIADIIESTSEAAAKSAVRSLSGEFSKKINQLNDELINLRVYVEAAIDFPDEDVDFISDQKIVNALDNIENSIETITAQAKQGQLIRDGLSLVIVGKPNAGKSSLLNLLAGQDVAIVNARAGTTRDILREDIQLDGLPLRIIDTAGLRSSDDEIEQEGIRRAKVEIEKADIVLFMRDSSDTIDQLSAQQTLNAIEKELLNSEITLLNNTAFVVVNNKIDLCDQAPQLGSHDLYTEINLSTKTREGFDDLVSSLKQLCDYTNNNENTFVARRRHIDALNKTRQSVANGRQQLIENAAGELLAEDLRQAQYHLGLITGVVSPDDLLGEIFSSFCIGK